MQMLKSILFAFILISEAFGQLDKSKQILNFKDSTKSIVVIEEFLLFDQSEQVYKPIEINYEDFFDYKKTPLGIRHFNFGCIKTKKSGFWLGQIDKDKFGHAIFEKPIYGIRAMVVLNIEIIEQRGHNTLLKFFSVYAPSNDCVGSIKDKQGNCLYGYNKPEKYASKVAEIVGLGINEEINLRNERGELNVQLLSILLSEVAKFETGKNCKLEEEIIKKAIEIQE